MGNFLSILHSGRQVLELSYLDCSSVKLREYYASFKLICEGFTIDSTEFSQIFGPFVNIFSVWDVERRRRIDALELFSGLILFSNSKFQEKVQLLFEMFDLNEEGWLSYESLQFMLLNCINASSRICQVQHPAPDEEIDAFLSEYFCSESQVSLQKLKVWACQTSEIIEFFQFINKEGPQVQPQETQLHIEPSLFESKSYNGFKNCELQIERTKLQPLAKLASVQFGGNSSKQDVQYFNPRPKWVFGIRIEDIRQPLRCVVGEGEKAANEKLLYFVGRAAIVYYPRLAEQRLYLEHQQEICCLAIDKRFTLAATGELSDRPAIHIWCIKTLSNVMLLSNSHRYPISHLLFLRNQRGVVSGSTHQSGAGSTILVHSLESGATIFSCHTPDPIINLITAPWILSNDSSSLSASNTASSSDQSTTPSPPNGDPQQSFLVVHSHSVVFYSLLKDSFQKHFFPMLKKDPITCTLASCTPGVLVTGHSSGTVVMWKRFSEPQELCKADDSDPSILSLVECLEPHTYCFLTSKNLYIFTVDSKELQCRPIPENVYHVRLVQLLLLRSKHLLLLGLMGELIEAKLSTTEAVTFRRLPYLFRLESVRAGCYSSQDGLFYLAFNSLVYKIDLATRELRNIYPFEAGIQCVAVGNRRIVVALENGDIIVSQGETISQRTRLAAEVRDMCVRASHLMVLTSKGVQLFILSQDKYFLKPGKKGNLQGYHFSKLQPTLNEKVYILTTREGDVLKVDLQLKFSVVAERILTEHLAGSIGNITFLYSARLNLNLAAGEDGDLVYYNSPEEMIKAPESCHRLRIHSSRISGIHYVEELERSDPSTTEFVTVGSADQMVVLWETVSVLKDTDAMGKSCFSAKGQQDAHVEQTLDDRHTPVEKCGSIRVSPTIGKPIQKLVNQMLIASKKGNQLIQPTSSKVGAKRLPPAASLKFNLVFGINTHSAKQSVNYCHVYYPNSRMEQPSKAVKPSVKLGRIPQQLRPDLQVCTRTLLPYTQHHNGCHKYVVYFTDRLVVRYCPVSKQQQYYDQHISAVSCLAVHPQKNIICSSQLPSKSSRAVIHLWKCDTFQTITTHVVMHRGHVTKLEFSRDGKLLCCVVTAGSTSVLCVLDWLGKRWLPERRIPTARVLDVIFDPYKSSELAVCGAGMLALFSCSGQALIMKEQAVLQRPSATVTCMSYISNLYGNSIESDILTGDDGGSIGLFICGKYLTVKEQAHKGKVSCLKVGELFRYKTVLISAGSDEAVRIWDTKMNLLSEINLRSLPCLNSLSKQTCLDPQSLDMYHCNHEPAQDNHTVLLIATRNGDVLQATVEKEYRGMELYTESLGTRNGKDFQPVKSEKQKESISLRCNVVLRSYPSGSVVKAAVHRNRLATATANHQLLLWDITSRDIVAAVDIKGSPSCLHFSHSGDMLVLGYDSGEVSLYDVADISLVQFHQLTHSGACVQSLQFSDSDSKLGISLTPVKINRDKIPFVSVYSVKGSMRRGQLTTLRETDRVVKLIEVSNRSNPSVISFMNFSCNDGQNQLLLWYRSAADRDQSDPQGKYVLWDLEKNEAKRSLEGAQFNTLNFSGIVKMAYFDRESEQGSEATQKAELAATGMAQIGSYLVLSSNNDGLALVRPDCFSNQVEHPEEWALARSYRANAGSITELVSSCSSPDQVYSVGKDSCIIRWTLQEEKESWDLDYSPIADIEDPFEEQLTKEQLDAQLHTLFPKRKSIFEALANQEPSTQPHAILRLNKIIGRTSYYKRNNIFCDYNDTLITFSGCNLVLIKKDKPSLKQQFVKIDYSEFSVYPQISAIGMSVNRQLLFIGTCSHKAEILTWEIGSRTFLSSVVLQDIVEVRCIRACFNSSQLAVVGLSPKNRARLIFLSQQEVLASYSFDYSLNTKLHDICFLPNESVKFITCGMHHMAEWRYASQTLSYESYQLEDINKEGLINTYCILFVNGHLVSGSAEGFLYLWEKKRITKRQEAHPKAAILALHYSNDSNIFASGGTDGRVILWQLTANVLQKLYEYSVNEGPTLTKASLVCHHVQSISIGSRSVIVGTRSGDIFELERPGENDTSDQEMSRGLLLPAFDHEEIIALRFSPSSKNMYVLTKAGTLSVLELDTLQKKQECQVDLHDKELIDMFVCQITEYIILVFLDEVQVFDSLKNHNELIKLAFCRFNRINSAVLSTNQRFLAVLLAANQTENSKLLVYSLNLRPKQREERRQQRSPYQDERASTFSLYHTIENLSANIDFVDFSVDNEYVVFKNRDDSDNIVTKLLSKERVNLLPTEFHIEWAGRGRKTLENVKAVNSFYSEDNQMLALVQILDKCVVATDEMGSLRIFSYPVSADHSYSHCLIEHMNNIKLCLATPNGQRVATYSSVDRCINIWEVATHSPFA